MMVSAGMITASGLLLLLLVASASALQTHHPASTTQTTRRGTSLSNMLRDYADYGYSNDPYSRSERSGASSTNWRKNQGYNLNRPTPPEIGGSVTGAGSMRDAEVNPYYDPGWAQSIRRDNPSSSRNYESGSNYNGYDDPYAYGPYLQNSHNYPSTFPGMTTPQKTARAADRAYRNPTNPYYEPLWSQGYVDDREPIREGDHAMYYAPGYEYSRNGFSNMGRGGGYYGGRGGAYYAVAVPSKSDAGGKVLNGNSFMR